MNDDDKAAVRQAGYDAWDELEANLPLAWAGSSPGAAEFRHEMIMRAEEVRLQMGLGPANDQPDADADQQGDEEPAPKPPKPDAALRRRLKAERRLGEIMNRGTNPPIAAEEFIELINNPAHGDRAELENAALVRLMRGYDASEGSTVWMAKVNNAFKTPTQTPLDEQIKAGQALSVGFGLSEAERRTQHILEHISVAAFAIDWLSLTGENSNREKGAFYAAAYQDIEEHRAFFESLPPADRQAQMEDEHRASYVQWRQKLEPQITARNRFVELYRAFGPAVFMDPFWNVASLTNNARTKDFPLLLSLVYDNIPHDPDDNERTVVQTRHRGSKKALQGTLRCIDRDLWKFMKDFLEENPDEIAQENV
ncbi:hypothetical protein DFH07DRAFT_967637 [Mycena maculata]|uniref:Uncharacterized protein n=1 Tax=Mycena maculata TaxID=230809 RepID=A0AAD7I421_9AGAR|nr:hypothetical protein DFH07DRAFT_967637 [Mycena maculata]